MPKYFMYFNNNTTIDENISIVKRPSIPAPTKKIRDRELPGRNGKLYEDLGTYEDIEFPVEFNFVSEPNQWHDDFRKIKKWFNSITDPKLKFSDDLGFFYKVNKANIDTPERIIKRIGRFTVIFNCEPFQYIEEGSNPIKLISPFVLNNYYEDCYPNFNIIGDGLLILNINGNVVTANVGQNLTINTELELTYRFDGVIKNASIKGYYKDLILKEGLNNISFNSGFNIEVIPNWRCI